MRRTAPLPLLVIPLLVIVLAFLGLPHLARADEPLLVARDPATHGLDFVHVGGERDHKRFLVEENGSGVALFDYDGDGDLDLYFVNGSRVERVLGAATEPPPGNVAIRNVLYRNDLQTDGTWSFVDVTDAAGVGDEGWGQGVAVGDVDGDGDVDLFVANYGPDVFYRNRGDGTFEDATAAVGLAGPGAATGAPSWSAAAAFADFDGDDDLDLYVSRYLDLDLRALSDGPPARCEYKGVEVACGPIGFPAQRDLVYEQRGGRFVEIEAGLGELSPEFGLGVLAADLDGDGRPDLVVANDSGANFLLQNVSDGSIRFEETAWLAGVATSEDGRFQAGMGVDAGDVDGDGVLDLFLTHFMDDHNTLYRGTGGGVLLFRDLSYPSGLGGPSRLRMAWGTRLFDVDHDGDLDVYVANGHLYPEVAAVPSETYAQADQLFLGDGAGRFVDASDRLVGTAETVSRGVATGDLDADGDLDVVVTQLDRPPLLLENRAENRAEGLEDNGWLRIETPSADGGAARVVLTSGERTQLRHVGTSGSYASAGEPAVHFGVGNDAGPFAVEVRRGATVLVRWRGFEAGRTFRLR